MRCPVEKILEEAFKLDPKDRALVVAELSSSEGATTPEVEAAWHEEIARRLKSPRRRNRRAPRVEWDEVNEEILHPQGRMKKLRVLATS